MQKGDTIKYEVINFNGYIALIRRDDGVYAVDPLFLGKFKEIMKIK